MTHPPLPPAEGAAWARQAERSSIPVMRFMVWLSLTLGRRLSRTVLHGIALYFLLFSPQAGRASRAYLQRVLGRAPGLAERYRHILTFATTIHDRIYFLNGRFDLFDIEIHGSEHVEALLAKGRGILLFGAHLGSFEVLRAVGHRYSTQPICMLMHAENARKINQVLAAINPDAHQDILPLGQLDSMLQLRDRLDAGQLVGVLADRNPGENGTRHLPFLGSPAPFPNGPFRLAALLQRPVLFMSGTWEGDRRYRVELSPLADFSGVEPRERATAITEAQQAYAARLEEHCRRAPYNWFNFFDFWSDPRSQPNPRAS
ncbi:acyl-CoA synthetase [Zoogloea sp.]|uniref:LpxL/LpxP family acyltransferase n=1 Tax=Zoogloea sp. TaxID=49181 RepID=UPI0035B1A463